MKECSTTRGSVERAMFDADSGITATRRPHVSRLVTFAGVLIAALSVAAPAMAWPMCGT